MTTASIFFVPLARDHGLRTMDHGQGLPDHGPWTTDGGG